MDKRKTNEKMQEKFGKMIIKMQKKKTTGTDLEKESGQRVEGLVAGANYRIKVSIHSEQGSRFRMYNLSRSRGRVDVSEARPHASVPIFRAPADAPTPSFSFCDLRIYLSHRAGGCVPIRQ